MPVMAEDKGGGQRAVGPGVTEGHDTAAGVGMHDRFEPPRPGPGWRRRRRGHRSTSMPLTATTSSEATTPWARRRRARERRVRCNPV